MGNALYTGLVCVIVSGHSQNEDEPILPRWMQPHGRGYIYVNEALKGNLSTCL